MPYLHSTRYFMRSVDQLIRGIVSTTDQQNAFPEIETCCLLHIADGLKRGRNFRYERRTI